MDSSEIINSTETKSVTIEPNKEITISEYLDKQVQYHPVCALLQPTVRSVIPSSLDITTSIIPYEYNEQSIGSVEVIINNPTT